MTIRETVSHAVWEDWFPRPFWWWLERRASNWGKEPPTEEDQSVANYFRNLPVGEHTLVVSNGPIGMAMYKAEGGMTWDLPDGKRLNVIPDLRAQRKASDASEPVNS